MCARLRLTLIITASSCFLFWHVSSMLLLSCRGASGGSSQTGLVRGGSADGRTESRFVAVPLVPACFAFVCSACVLLGPMLPALWARPCLQLLIGLARNISIQCYTVHFWQENHQTHTSTPGTWYTVPFRYHPPSILFFALRGECGNV